MEFHNRPPHIRLEADTTRDVVQIAASDWQLIPFDIPQVGGHGSNSYVFEGYPIDDESQRAIIKVCRYYSGGALPKAIQRVDRFNREITALEMIKRSGKAGIAVDILSHGSFKIRDVNSGGSHSFRYYVMEKADQDLEHYLADNRLIEQQRIFICFSLLQSLKRLHELGIYHRDIKPANILFFNNTWKLADLGLARFRNEDVEIDSPTEIVGPIGWLSPEAVNRAFSNRGDKAFAADIDISDASDVFQLGKLFWYILYGSLPTGQLDAMDCATQGMFASVFSPMLQYSKQRRASITRVEAAFKPILSSYGI